MALPYVTSIEAQKISKDIAEQVVEESGGGGTDVVANPTLSGGETSLTSIQIGEDKYKVAADITVDSALSDSSINPVQNKVVTGALNGKQATLVGSGTGQNIKTINNNSLVGSGNITISEGTNVVANPTLEGSEDNLTGLQVGSTKYKVAAGGSSVITNAMDYFKISFNNFPTDVDSDMGYQIHPNFTLTATDEANLLNIAYNYLDLGSHYEVGDGVFIYFTIDAMETLLASAGSYVYAGTIEGTYNENGTIDGAWVGTMQASDGIYIPEHIDFLSQPVCGVGYIKFSCDYDSNGASWENPVYCKYDFSNWGYNS